jgi:hypothetical protein
MLDPRVVDEIELSVDAQHDRFERSALELDSLLDEIGLDAYQPLQKVVVPEGATDFAVGDALQPCVFLLPDHVLDRLVLDGLQTGIVKLAALVLGARLFQRGGTQEAADMLGAKRRVHLEHFWNSGLGLN